MVSSVDLLFWSIRPIAWENIDANSVPPPGVFAGAEMRAAAEATLGVEMGATLAVEMAVIGIDITSSSHHFIKSMERMIMSLIACIAATFPA